MLACPKELDSFYNQCGSDCMSAIRLYRQIGAIRLKLPICNPKWTCCTVHAYKLTPTLSEMMECSGVQNTYGLYHLLSWNQLANTYNWQTFVLGLARQSCSWTLFLQWWLALILQYLNCCKLAIVSSTMSSFVWESSPRLHTLLPR